MPPHSIRRTSQCTAFSLVELLVVVALVVVLAALLFPAIRSVRESAKRAQCCSNLRQLGMAVAAFRQDARAFPNGNTGNWPQEVAYATLVNLEQGYDLNRRFWNCPDAWPLIFTDNMGIPIAEATARTLPYSHQACTSYQYLANFTYPTPWMIRPGHDQADLALAGDVLLTVNGTYTGNHIATTAWAWDANANRGSWGTNELFLDGSVKWVPASRTTGYFTNWATFLMALTNDK